MSATFDELIIIYWVDPANPDKTVWTQAFSDFADLIMESRYYQIRSSNKYNSMILVDDLRDIMAYVTDWAKLRIPFQRQDEYKTPTVFFGFQGSPGWTDPEFHDILNKVASIPGYFPGIKVEWLPDNWFDHPGLTPPNMNVEQTLAWLEQQISTAEPEEIQYDFKGVHNEPPF